MNYKEIAKRLVKYKISKGEIPKINNDYVNEIHKKFSNDVMDFELDSKEGYAEKYLPFIKMRHSKFKFMREFSRK